MSSASLRTTISNYFIYAGGTIIVRAGHLFLLPLWMKLLSPSEYGLLSLLTGFQLLIKYISFGGLISVANINLFHGTVDQTRYKIGSVCTTHLLFAIPLLSGIGVALPYLNNHFFKGYATTSIIIALLLNCFFQFYQALSYALLCNKQLAKQATIAEVCTQFAGFIMNYFFIVILRKGVGGVIYAQLITSTCSALVQASIAYQVVQPLFARSFTTVLEQAYKNLRLGLSFTIYSLSPRLFSNIDRLVLLHYTSLRVVGIYSLASRIALLGYECIISPLLTTYRPYIFTRYQDTNHQEVERERSWHTILFFTISSTALFSAYLLLKPLAVLLIPSTFLSAIPLCLFLSWEKIIAGAGLLTTMYITYLKKIRSLAALTISAQLLNCILNLIVVQKYGIWGCTVATAFASLAHLIAAQCVIHHILRKQITPARKTDATITHSQAHTQENNA